jgi:putative inorganic carbon (HCO3(-)) transporter
MVLVSTMVTPDLPFSLGKVVGTLYGFCLFYAAVAWSRRRVSILPLAVLAAGLGAGAALLGLLGTDWVVKIPVLRGVMQVLPAAIRGVPGAESGFNPNQVAGALIMLVPVQATTLWALVSDSALSRRRKVVLGAVVTIGLALTLAVILLAQSRVAWAALLLGLLLLLVAVARRFRLAWLLLLLAILVVVVSVGPVGVGQWFVERGWLIESGDASWAERIELWQVGLAVVSDHPFTGTGMNLFRQIARQRSPLFHFALDHDIGHSHQTYLQVALDLGIPGLIFYLSALGGALAVGWQTFRQAGQRLARSSAPRIIALGGTVGLLVHAVWGLTDAVALGAKQGFLWWLVLALVVASASPRQGGVPSLGQEGGER